MEREFKDNYDVLYNTKLKDIERNLSKFIEAKHENLKEKIHVKNDKFEN